MIARATFLLPLLLALVFASGCLYIPLPQVGHLGGHGEIGEAEVARIVPGRTDREALLGMFGEPDASLLADRLFVYTWAKAGGFLLANESGPTPRRNVFLVLFDDAGYVLRTGRQDPGFLADVTAGDEMTALVRAAEDWAAASYRQ